jgi:hypothetical protein
MSFKLVHLSNCIALFHSRVPGNYQVSATGWTVENRRGGFPVVEDPQLSL